MSLGDRNNHQRQVVVRCQKQPLETEVVVRCQKQPQEIEVVVR